MINRIRGVMRLDPAICEQVEHDQSATGQAAIILFLVVLFNRIGRFLIVPTLNMLEEWLSDLDIPSIDILFESDMLDLSVGASSNIFSLGSFVSAFLNWLLWSALIYFIGTRLFKGESTFSGILRLLGFAQAPRIFTIFIFIPLVGGFIYLFCYFRVFIISLRACQQALGLSSKSIILTLVISFILNFFINVLLLTPIYRLLPF